MEDHKCRVCKHWLLAAMRLQCGHSMCYDCTTVETTCAVCNVKIASIAVDHTARDNARVAGGGEADREYGNWLRLRDLRTRVLVDAMTGTILSEGEVDPDLQLAVVRVLSIAEASKRTVSPISFSARNTNEKFGVGFVYFKCSGLIDGYSAVPDCAPRPLSVRVPTGVYVAFAMPLPLEPAHSSPSLALPPARRQRSNSPCGGYDD